VKQYLIKPGEKPSPFNNEGIPLFLTAAGAGEIEEIM